MSRKDCSSWCILFLDSYPTKAIVSFLFFIYHKLFLSNIIRFANNFLLFCPLCSVCVHYFLLMYIIFLFCPPFVVSIHIYKFLSNIFCFCPRFYYTSLNFVVFLYANDNQIICWTPVPLLLVLTVVNMFGWQKRWWITSSYPCLMARLYSWCCPTIW